MSYKSWHLDSPSKSDLTLRKTSLLLMLSEFLLTVETLLQVNIVSGHSSLIYTSMC